MARTPIMTDRSTGFRTKILNSAKLSTLRFMSEIALRLVSTIVLTRLLAPEVYGVFATVLVFLYLLEMFSDLGLRSLILTKEGDVDNSFLWTCWTVSVLRGLLVGVCATLIALVIGVLQAGGIFAPESAYSAAVLPWAIAALGGVAFIGGLQSPMAWVYERQMQFGRVTAVQIAVNVIGLVATIAVAIALQSVWALVLGNLVKTITHVILSYVVFRGPAMRLHLGRTNLSLVIARGKWIIGHSTLHAVSQSADRLVLGLMMSSTTFGFYFIARQLVDMVALRFLEAIHAPMGLQVFAHILQSTTADFRRNYYRYRLFFDALAGLSAGGLLVLAPLVVEIVFDDRYRGVAPIIQILILGTLLTGALLLRSAFTAERRFKRMTLASLLSTGTLLFGLFMTAFVFQSVTASLFVIALYRVPEAALLISMGWQRGWIAPLRELNILAFFAVGAAAGWAILWAWERMT